MHRPLAKFICVISSLLAFAFSSTAQPVQLKDAVILVSPSVPSGMQTTVSQVLSEEIAKRTGMVLKNTANWPKKGTPTVALVLSTDQQLLGTAIPVRNNMNGAEYKKE